MGRMYLNEKELDRLHAFTKACGEKMGPNKIPKLLTNS